MGIIFGMLYFILIKRTQPKWTYFLKGPSDRQSCRRIGKTKFKCTIRRVQINILLNIFCMKLSKIFPKT